MHSIKYKARSFARRHKGDSNFNPFARTSSRSAAPDEEEGLQRACSEGIFRSSVETERFRNSQVERQDFGGVPHANTAPPASATSPTSPYVNPPSHPSTEGEPSSSEANGSPIAPKSTVDAEKGSTRRRMGGLLGEKNDNEKEGESSATKDTEKRKSRPITIQSQIRATVFGSWINILLLVVPAGFAVNYAHLNGVVIFVVNFIAIIPLAGMLSYATEELALRVGETLGGLLNATFGNAVELIVSIIALVQNQIIIVQTSLIGSMLSNLLLVMGMCFFFGGINRLEQYFNITVAQTAASLLSLAVGALLVPTVFDQASFAGTDLDTNSPQVARISRGTAIILLVVYGCYLFFQLRTHVDMYNEPSKKSPKKNSHVEEGAIKAAVAKVGGSAAASAGGQQQQERLDQKPDEEAEEPQLTLIGAIVTLCASTVLVAFCAEFMTSSIKDIAGSVSEEFIGLILLPIVGNAAEHATALTVACKDKMDLAIGVAVGSSMQIALLVLPLSVVLGWIIGTDPVMTLDFDGFQIVVLFVAILLVNYLIQDGKSHWLEGALLMALYLIIAVTAWFYPTNQEVA
ncbi:Calcium/proton exchanger [Viridothelium virens]|uniref:Vacuolar calcium ion transporter n=1 Tax=Viridothelium virens TaxID=1048519 RepID=A0A6A6HRM5_VIRVR|nr:Calcium/proton exchanger [Viridothelium virens]